MNDGSISSGGVPTPWTGEDTESGTLPHVDYTIEFAEDGLPDLTITLRGVGDPGAVARCNTEIAADPRFQAGLTILVDLSKFATRRVSESQADATIDRILERDWDRPAAAIAFVVGDDQAARELMLWRARLGGSRSRREIFTTRDDAVAWLSAQ